MIRKTPGIACLIFLAVFITPVSYAAFPVQQYNISPSGANNIITASQVPVTGIVVTPGIQQQDSGTKRKKGKKQEVAALLAFFLGWTGLHRFYLGYPTTGAVQAFTLPVLLVSLLILSGTATGIAFFLGFTLLFFSIVLGLWELIDFFRIAGNDLKPKDSEYINEWQ